MYFVHRAMSKPEAHRGARHAQEGSQARSFVRNSKGRRASAQDDWESMKTKAALELEQGQRQRDGKFPKTRA